jgi:lipoprotein signal peptidase
VNARLRSVSIIALVIALDRITKIYIRDHFSPFDVRPVIAGFFNIVHTENPGAAFGMLAESPGAWRGLVLVGVSLAVIRQLRIPELQRRRQRNHRRRRAFVARFVDESRKESSKLKEPW